MERVPALIDAEVDILCIDSSDGFSEWQYETLQYVKTHYPDIPIGGGNVVDREGFRYLAEAGADFIKVGIGGGSICITREQKGIGCGQATAVQIVAEAEMNILPRRAFIFLFVPMVALYMITTRPRLGYGSRLLMPVATLLDLTRVQLNSKFINGMYVKEYWGEGRIVRETAALVTGRMRKAVCLEEASTPMFPMPTH